MKSHRGTWSGDAVSLVRPLVLGDRALTGFFPAAALRDRGRSPGCLRWVPLGAAIRGRGLLAVVTSGPGRVRAQPAKCSCLRRSRTWARAAEGSCLKSAHRLSSGLRLPLSAHLANTARSGGEMLLMLWRSCRRSSCPPAAPERQRLHSDTNMVWRLPSGRVTERRDMARTAVMCGASG